MKQAIMVNFRTKGSSDEGAFNRFLDAVQDELLELDSVVDPNLSASLANRSISIMLTVDADSPEDMVGTAMAAIRTAFHAAGAATPTWPTREDWLSFSGLLIGEELISSSG